MKKDLQNSDKAQNTNNNKHCKPIQNTIARSNLNKTKQMTKFAFMELLKFVANVAEATFLIADKKAVYKYAYGYGWNNRDISRGVYYLRRNGYLKTKKDSNLNSIQLTNKAKLKIVEYLVKSRSKSEKYRFLSFDIPTKLNSNRNRFRRCLKKIGFVKVQQSLWVIDKDVSDLVEVAMFEYKVEKYCAYIVSEQSDIDGIVKKILPKKT